jgi:hypothetical protein
MSISDELKCVKLDSYQILCFTGHFLIGLQVTGYDGNFDSIGIYGFNPLSVYALGFMLKMCPYFTLDVY